MGRAAVAVVLVTSWLALFDVRPTAAVARNTTIDPRVQLVAADAVAAAPLPTELVAIQPSTGDVLAYASHGPGLAADDALVGKYPTGSTFKIITSAALIAHGLSPQSPATCPGSLTVDGGTLTTYNNLADPTVETLSDAFARSCDTAFATLGAQLLTTDYKSAAASFGLGKPLSLGRPAFAGTVANPTSSYDRATLAAYGATSVVSPLVLANVAATVDSGRLRPVRLLTHATVRGKPHQLDRRVITGLRSMMAAAVTNGTATGYGLPADTHAKTGTARFANTPSPQTTYAWLIGYRADLAFAVLVLGGTQGGPAAGPIAARFLTALPPTPAQ